MLLVHRKHDGKPGPVFKNELLRHFVISPFFFTKNRNTVTKETTMCAAAAVRGMVAAACEIAVAAVGLQNVIDLHPRVDDGRRRVEEDEKVERHLAVFFSRGPATRVYV